MVMTSLLVTSNMDVRHEKKLEFLRHEGIKQVEIVETLQKVSAVRYIQIINFG